MADDVDRYLADLAAAQHSVFSYADALAVGMSERQIARRVQRRWHVVHDGVYRMPGAVATWRSELLAACLAATRPVAVSRRAASAIYGLPYRNDKDVEIVCRRWKRTQKPGLIVHESTRFDEIDIQDVDGIPVVTPERLILELSGLYPYPNAVEKVIQAARRKRLISYGSTVATFERLARRGVPGVQAMRVALERWDPTSSPTHSEMETWLIQILRGHGLGEPTTQFVVLDDEGQFVAQTDAALPRWKITFEYQSKQEHLDEFQSMNDDHRRNRIIGAGYWPLAARYEDLRQGGHALVEEVRRVIRRENAKPASMTDRFGL